ncbi:MAG: F0F1 ATP synthase subunit A [Chloroflexi bacterium]|nr:F0F1 ATP synthase subunit A [Chloroflexota bacterium]
MAYAIAIGLLVLAGVGISFFRGPIAIISLPAETIVHGFFLTNTMIAGWLTIAVLMGLSYAATGFSGAKMKLVPSGVQSMMEAVIEALFAFTTSVAGEENGRKFFPLIGTIFLFIMTSAWLALLPGFGTIGTVQKSEYHHGEGTTFTSAGAVAFIMPGAKNLVPHHDTHAAAPAADSHGAAAPAVNADDHGAAAKPAGQFEGALVPFLRSVNTDLNTPLAIALTAMTFIEMWGLQALGIGYLGKFLNFKEGPIGVFVGLLELISEFSKIISFTFRLFGNMFAGEVLLTVISFLVPWVALLPFLGLEIFVGFVQALVFAGLTLVFATMAVAAHGEHEESHGEDHGAEPAGHGAPAHGAPAGHH